MNNRIAEIRARCEREKAIDAAGRKANGAYITTIPYLLTLLDERDEAIADLNDEIAMAQDGAKESQAEIDRLRELVEADADGRCVVLPKKGDKLYYAPYPKGAKDLTGEPMFLRNKGDGSGIVETVTVSVCFENWFGPVPLKKTWNTPEAAEAARKEDGK